MKYVFQAERVWKRYNELNQDALNALSLFHKTNAYTDRALHVSHTCLSTL